MKDNDFLKKVNEYKKDCDDYWNSLTKEQQLMAFCSVVNRIYEGDIEKGGTYRYVLYEVFGFEPDAYIPAQMAGYMDIHNTLFDGKKHQKILEMESENKLAK